ncbi:MAG: hypothetical protein FWD32_00735 [Firmicutes bacterium]|nr:hypothetical protein [Bacillota bacterium]
MDYKYYRLYRTNEVADLDRPEYMEFLFGDNQPYKIDQVEYKNLPKEVIDYFKKGEMEDIGQPKPFAHEVFDSFHHHFHYAIPESTYFSEEYARNMTEEEFDKIQHWKEFDYNIENGFNIYYVQDEDAVENDYDVFSYFYDGSTEANSWCWYLMVRNGKSINYKYCFVIRSI